MTPPHAGKRSLTEERPRFLCFYLPQFYPTSYNDEWWGKGFTEWTNVVKARPRFRGHYQPHLPADLGFYDLRLPEAREAQAELAREYGIYGFCYYHYWFNGRRILERPLDEVLVSKRPQFPFSVCWANENWTRAWEGHDRKVLLEQHYSDDDDLAHIRSLIPTLQDERYIRVEGKPLLLVYRVEALPHPRHTAQIWRDEAGKAGLGDLFLVNIQSNEASAETVPSEVGFDAAVQFQPNIHWFRGALPRRALSWAKSKVSDRIFVHSYPRLVERWKASPPAPYRHFECVTPMWDDSPRRQRNATVFRDSTPELYESWLRRAVERSNPDRDGRRWLFINAWNEWAEGCHLEPCQKWGRAYLEATRRVFAGA